MGLKPLVSVVLHSKPDAAGGPALQQWARGCLWVGRREKLLVMASNLVIRERSLVSIEHSCDWQHLVASAQSSSSPPTKQKARNLMDLECMPGLLYHHSSKKRRQGEWKTQNQSPCPPSAFLRDVEAEFMWPAGPPWEAPQGKWTYSEHQ